MIYYGSNLQIVFNNNITLNISFDQKVTLKKKPILVQAVQNGKQLNTHGVLLHTASMRAGCQSVYIW